MQLARYQIIHDTHYRYSAPVSLAQQLAHLSPRECEWQINHACELEVSPQPCMRRDVLDVFGNPLTRLVFERPHGSLKISARLRIDVLARADISLADSPAWEDACAALSYSGNALPVGLLEACKFRFQSPYVRVKHNFADYAADCFTPRKPLLLAVHALMNKIFSEFTFDAVATQVATPLLQVLEERRGVCQDFAHLMLACLRSQGLAARYVSGYLLTQPPPGQPRLIGADASHAWISVYCPRQGWVDFDPTNNIRPALEHITLAWGRDFADVSPLHGVILGGGEHDPEVQVTVLPLTEDAEIAQY